MGFGEGGNRIMRTQKEKSLLRKNLMTLWHCLYYVYMAEYSVGFEWTPCFSRKCKTHGQQGSWQCHKCCEHLLFQNIGASLSLSAEQCNLIKDRGLGLSNNLVLPFSVVVLMTTEHIQEIKLKFSYGWLSPSAQVTDISTSVCWAPECFWIRDLRWLIIDEFSDLLYFSFP